MIRSYEADRVILLDLHDIADTRDALKRAIARIETEMGGGEVSSTQVEDRSALYTLMLACGAE